MKRLFRLYCKIQKRFIMHSGYLMHNDGIARIQEFEHREDAEGVRNLLNEMDGYDVLIVIGPDHVRGDI